jgi:hypothetical protein
MAEIDTMQFGYSLLEPTKHLPARLIRLWVRVVIRRDGVDPNHVSPGKAVRANTARLVHTLWPTCQRESCRCGT